MKNELTRFQAGERVKIVEISTGHHAALQLSQLGINSGDIVVIMRVSTLRGPIIISSRNAELAIGYGLARKIIGETI